MSKEHVKNRNEKRSNTRIQHLLCNGKRRVCVVPRAINDFLWFQCRIGSIQGRPIWQKVCVVSRAIYFWDKTGVKFMKVAKLYSTWGYTDDFHTESAKKHHVVWLFPNVDIRVKHFMQCEGSMIWWASVSIFFIFVVGFSLPKLAFFLHNFVLNILWQSCERVLFVSWTDMLSSFQFAKKGTTRSIHFAKNEK